MLTTSWRCSTTLPRRHTPLSQWLIFVNHLTAFFYATPVIAVVFYDSVTQRFVDMRWSGGKMISLIRYSFLRFEKKNLQSSCGDSIRLRASISVEWLKIPLLQHGTNMKIVVMWFPIFICNRVKTCINLHWFFSCGWVQFLRQHNGYLFGWT